jgi:hypothetical protein
VRQALLPSDFDALQHQGAYYWALTHPGYYSASADGRLQGTHECDRCSTRLAAAPEPCLCAGCGGARYCREACGAGRWAREADAAESRAGHGLFCGVAARGAAAAAARFAAAAAAWPSAPAAAAGPAAPAPAPAPAARCAAAAPPLVGAAPRGARAPPAEPGVGAWPARAPGMAPPVAPADDQIMGVLRGLGGARVISQPTAGDNPKVLRRFRDSLPFS